MREAVRDRDCCRELADILMEDIEEMSSMKERELAALQAKLDRRGPAPLGTKAVQLRSRVAGLEDELTTLT